MKVFEGIMTSSFCLIPKLSNAMCNPAVAEDTPHPNLLPLNFANFFSNLETFSPKVSLPPLIAFPISR